MRTRTKALIAGAAVVALGAGGAGYAVATGDDESTPPIKGSALERASEAALQATGGGTVTETEAGDEESYYEVEVTTDSGQTDVQLDRDFNVVGTEGDGSEAEGAGDD